MDKDKILAAREIRQLEIEKLKTTYKTVITAKTNIPGKNKSIYFSYRILKRMINQIPKEIYVYKSYHDGFDGPYYLLGTNLDGLEIKTLMVQMEETDSLGRFIDLDVYTQDNILSRTKMRKCYICNKDAFVCNRENNHTIGQLIAFMEKKFRLEFERELFHMIDQSILMELKLHPKFGLVTPLTSGSHEDMNFEIMLKAKNAIIPFLIEMFRCGFTKTSLENVFYEIRTIGKQAEIKMLEATNNINAYKGLIFNMGIFVTAMGYLLYNNKELSEIYHLISQLSKPVLMDFNNPRDTSGLEAYYKYGIEGIRGESVSGMPSVKKAIEILEDFSEETKLKTLAFLIGRVEDTVLLKRSQSFSNYKKIKSQFKHLNTSDSLAVNNLNEYCIKNHLSFGGSADLLIITILLKMIQQSWY